MDKKENKPNFIDESFRIDDNSDLSQTAIIESEGMSDPLIPGVGIESENLEESEE